MLEDFVDDDIQELFLGDVPMALNLVIQLDPELLEHLMHLFVGQVAPVSKRIRKQTL